MRRPTCRGPRSARHITVTFTRRGVRDPGDGIAAATTRRLCPRLIWMLIRAPDPQAAREHSFQSKWITMKIRYSPSPGSWSWCSRSRRFARLRQALSRLHEPRNELSPLRRCTGKLAPRGRPARLWTQNTSRDSAALHASEQPGAGPSRYLEMVICAHSLGPYSGVMFAFRQDPAAT